MQLHGLSALGALGLLIGAMCAGVPGLAETTTAECPPEEQAVLGAYRQCAAFHAQVAPAETAPELEAHAARLVGACGTHTSEFLGFDAYQELLDCAQAMAEAGQVAQARTVEPVAQAYRAEQMRRLIMHGGELLDPARYLGRPVDYEQKSATVGPVEERITTPELSAGKPKGGGWQLLTSEERMPLVYWKDPAWMSTRPVKGQSVLVVLTARSPGFARSISAREFPSALEKLLRRSAGKKSRIISLSVTHARQPDDYCADYVMTSEQDSSIPDLPGVVIETTTRGFACLERSSSFVVQAYYDEDKPVGAASVLDDVVRGEAEAFLHDILFEPKR